MVFIHLVNIDKEYKMSIVSSLLKARFGVPEIDLMKNPITKKIFGDLQNKELEKIIKALPDETLKIMIELCQEELDKR
jgi:uncharacterized protein YcgL (UPF0745 family)